MSNEYIMTPAESIPYGRTASPQCGSVFKKSSMGSPLREIRNASGASSTAEFDLEEDILIGSPGLAQLPSSGLSQTSVDSHSVNSLDSINSVTSNVSAYASNKKFRPKTLSIPGLGKISLSPRHQILPSHECIPISGSLPTRKPKDKNVISWVGNTNGIRKDIRGNAHCAPSSHYELTSFPGNFKSAPSTPLGGSGRNLSGSSAWTIGNGGPDFGNYFLSGSISSIDEAQEAVSGRQCVRKEKSANEVDSGQGHLSPAKGSRTRSKSRLSLNINDAHQGRDNLTVSPSQAIEVSESNPSKSQNLIPKFLRNSFSKLMNRDKRSSEDEVVIKQLNKPISPSQEESSSLSQSIRSLSGKSHPLQSNNNNYNYYNNQIWGEKDEVDNGDFSPETSGLIAESPTMSQFYEDAKVMALPVIPFAFPTAVLAERMKTRNREALLKKKGQIVREKTPSGDSNKTLKSSPKEIRSSASSRRSNSIVCCDDDFGPKTLDSLVSIAKMELYSEALQGRTNVDEIIATSMRIKSPPMRPRLPRADSFTDEEDVMLHMPPTNVSRTFEDDGYLEMCPKQQQQQYDRILYQEPHQPFQSQFSQTPPSASKAFLRLDSMEEHFPMDMSQS